jgi:hypothetical protein
LQARLDFGQGQEILHVLAVVSRGIVPLDFRLFQSGREFLAKAQHVYWILRLILNVVYFDLYLGVFR